MARVLGAEGRGNYAVVITVAAAAVAVGHLSLESAQVALWKEEALRPAFAANAVLLAGLLGAPLALITWALVRWLGEARVPIYSDTGLILGLIAVPFGILVLWLNNLLSLTSRVSCINVGLVVSAVVQLALVLALTAAGRLTVTAAVLGWMVLSVLPALIAVFALRPTLSSASLHVLRRTCTSGLRYHSGVLFLFLLFRLDLLVVNAQMSPRDVGLYALALTLAELVYLIGDSVAQAIVGRQAGVNQEAAAEVTAGAVRFGTWGVTFVALGLAGAAWLVVPTIYGAEFRDAVPVLWLLLPGSVALAVCRPLAVLLAARDRPALLAGLAGAALVVHVVLLAALVPAWGLAGAAVAATIGYLALAAGYLWTVHRLTTLTWKDLRPSAADLREVVRRAAPPGRSTRDML